MNKFSLMSSIKMKKNVVQGSKNLNNKEVSIIANKFLGDMKPKERAKANKRACMNKIL